MEELKERISRLEKVLLQIESGERYEHDFPKLYAILQNEYRLEGGTTAPYIMGNYRHNLEQTIEKQADTYKQMLKKRPKKGAPYEYKDFINNFTQDVSEELTRCKYRLNSPSS